MTPCTLIIGYGSDLRGDDALGRHAAVMLEDRITDRNVCVISRASLTPELAHDLSLVEHVIFIDCDATLPAGRIQRREVAAGSEADAMVHFLDPPGLLNWAKVLYGARPRAVLFAMGGATFECADDLSPQVEDGMDDLVKQVLAELEPQASQMEQRRA